MDIFKDSNHETLSFLRKEGYEILKKSTPAKNALLALPLVKLIKKFSILTIDEVNFVLSNKPEILKHSVSKKENQYVAYYASQNSDVYVLDAVFKAYKKENLDIREMEGEEKTIHAAISKDKLDNFLYLLNYYNVNLTPLFKLAFEQRAINIMNFLLQKEEKFNVVLFNCMEQTYQFKEKISFFESISANPTYSYQKNKESLFALSVRSLFEVYYHDKKEQIDILKSYITYFTSKGCSLDESYSLHSHNAGKTVLQYIEEFKPRLSDNLRQDFDLFLVEIEKKSLNKILNEPVKSGKNLKI